MSETMQNLLQHFEQEKLIGIVRTSTTKSALWASEVLLKSGFRIIEIPYTVPDAGHVIETLCEQFPDAIIGAGTILEAREALNALGAGARFLVSPVLVEPLIQFGQEQEILTLPGCTTPTEMHKAWTLGAPAVKFFPAESSGGAGFVSSLKGPLPQIPIIPTGGIQLENVCAYWQAGAVAVGIGTPLIPQKLVDSRDEAGIASLAHQYLEARETFCAHLSQCR